MLMAAPTSAVLDYTDVQGIGFGGGLWAPIMNGYNLDYEPIQMGYIGGVNFKYGFTGSFILNLGLGYGMTYDDSTASNDQSFKLAKSDDAQLKITGVFTELTAQYYLLPESGIRPYLLGGLGVNFWKYEPQVSGFDSENTSDLVLKGGTGVEFALGEKMGLDFGLKFNFLPSYISKPDSLMGAEFSDKPADRSFQAYLEPALKFSYYIGGGKDNDRDGVKDDFDQCPSTPIGARVDASGCPLDEDRDGVYDGLDRCPNTPRGAGIDVNGCPMDSDRDGIFDGIDKCPSSPAGVSVDNKGCPLDEDGDGVFDYKDKCPLTPRGARVDSKGCPRDSDGDGVYDGIDSCPNTPAGIAVNDHGCPTANPIEENIIVHIDYKRGSVEPDAAAEETLNDVAQRMAAYPDVKLQINAYTDALGTAKLNLRLSQQRADAIKNYLVRQGVSASRLVAKGFGETNFLVPDKNSRENRRIEIIPVK